MLINITENTNTNTNISMRSEDNFYSGVNWFGITNLTYSNVSSGGLNKSMTLVYNETDPFADWINIPFPGKGNTTTKEAYFWIRIPASQAAGTYTTNITVRVNQSA
jgi:hypothetical protein